MKNLAILFGFTNPSKRPFEFIHDHFMEKVYFDFFDLLMKKGTTTYIVREVKNAINNNTFSAGFKYLGNGEFLEQQDRIIADIVWDRTTPGSGYPKSTDSVGVDIVNSMDFKEFVDNKWETYKKYPIYFPKTILVEEIGDIPEYLKEIETERFVFKPIESFGGKGVCLFNKQDPSDFVTFIKQNPQYISKSIIQNFCDCSVGIPGLIDGKHDLRLMISNKKIIFSYLRVPIDPNEFRANHSLGGKIIPVEINKIPQNIIAYVEKLIEEYYCKYNNPFYSIDLFNTTKGLYLIELNGASTGFPEPGNLNNFYELLSERFI